MWTSKQLADELGADRHRITKIAQRRGWRRWEGEWLFTAEQADEIRRTIRAWNGHPPKFSSLCSVDGCERPLIVKGMCNAHYRRVSRHGSTERLDGAAHQRAKTHCPQGHEYTPENTVVWPSEGRRRCRTCILERARPVGFRRASEYDDLG